MIRAVVKTWKTPSKILLEVPGNAGVESEARVWIESNAEFGERADDSCRRESIPLRAKV
jgi:hypothetical protein